MLFANGIHTPVNPYSRVVEFDPATGETKWEYQGSPIWTFFSPNISGVQLFSNGNRLICEGQMGRVFEVTVSGEVVWEYVCPFFCGLRRKWPGQFSLPCLPLHAGIA